jgi:hypothetical protein
MSLEVNNIQGAPKKFGEWYQKKERKKERRRRRRGKKKKRYKQINYSKTCLKRNRTGPENFSAKAGFRLTRLKRNISAKARFLTEQ